LLDIQMFRVTLIFTYDLLVMEFVTYFTSARGILFLLLDCHKLKKRQKLNTIHDTLLIYKNRTDPFINKTNC
jgi:hypothetical protein